jgi:hypothetical protein
MYRSVLWRALDENRVLFGSSGKLAQRYQAMRCPSTACYSPLNARRFLAGLGMIHEQEMLMNR